jgi:hypothetical protein
MSTDLIVRTVIALGAVIAFFWLAERFTQGWRRKNPKP